MSVIFQAISRSGCWPSACFSAGLLAPLLALLTAMQSAVAVGDSLARADRFRALYGFGYRQDQLDWNIAADPSGTATPNVLSELTWSDMDIYEGALDLYWTAGNGLYLHSAISYGVVTDGQVQDSDYSSDGRQGEYSRSENGADGDRVFDASFAVGRQWGLGPQFAEHLRISPVIGVATHRQRFNITDGVQTIATAGVPLGPFLGLDSQYDAQWNGAFVGLDLEWQLSGALAVLAAYQLHRVDYEAEANWNLRTDLAHPVSFAHDAEGSGDVFSLKLAYRSQYGWEWLLVADYQNWETDPGRAYTFASDGSSSLTRLNAVHWDTWSLSFGVLLPH